MAESGLLEWSNGIRLKMASDPGRQLFADQIQKDGFLFLDDYLSNILAGAKQENGLIDLVKTPSRNRIAPRLPKTASKLKNIVAISFEATTLVQNKENIKPLNLFPPITPQKVQEKPNVPPPAPSPVLSTPAMPAPTPSAETPPPTTEPHVSPSSPPHEPPAEALLHIQEDAPPVHADLSDLSVIAEDEEPLERAETSITPPNLTPSASSHSDDDTALSRSSADTFQSIPLNSPAPLPSPELVNSEGPAQSMDVSPIDFGVETDLMVPLKADDSMDITGPLPPASQRSPSPDADAMDTTESIALSSSRPSVSQFPTLPAPQHLQKTPGAALGGKRTSWLMKAREVKALDIVVKKQSVAGPSSVNPLALNSGLKRKSSSPALGGASTHEEESKSFKAPKKVESDVAPLQIRKETVHDQLVETKRFSIEPEDTSPPEGDLGQLRKTLEGFKTRTGMGKSLGGAAAIALAEARAAAEARVVERNETMSIALNVQHEDEDSPTVEATPPSPPVNPSSAQPVNAPEPRFSLSELRSDRETPSVPKKADSVFHKPPPPTSERSSPTVSLPPSDVPVFHKPQPVFRPPSPKAAANTFNAGPKSLGMSPFSMPASMSLGLGARLPSPTGARAQPLSKNSTAESMASESVFDSQGPAWLPSTQDTNYDSDRETQSQQSVYEGKKPIQILDEDDSWPMDEKLAEEGVAWTFGTAADDSMTWSSMPTSSQKLDKVGDGVTDHQPIASGSTTAPPEMEETPDMVVDTAEDDDEYLADNDISIDPSRMTVNLVNPSHNQSQSSLAESSTSPMGLIRGVYNTFLGKKSKPEVKSLQLAAAAAKKEQDEKDKKASVLKNMESRRQQAIQKKAEEDKARALLEEKKIKEENERRKREREEHTDKRPLAKPTPLKKQPSQDEETNTKKRKILNHSESKSELKKASSKSNIASSSKSTFKPSSKPVAGSSSQESEPKAKATPASKSKIQPPAKARPPPTQDDDISQPSQMLHSQMAVRVQAQIDAAANVVPSESIELPDINSEYSDSDDEDRQKYQAPDWAQSPYLHQALASQAGIDPDEVFGPIQPLRMEEVFRTRSSRFRARTSSANWAGADRLTQEEQADYARRMGFRQ